MSKALWKHDRDSNLLRVFLPDASSTTGAGLTGLSSTSTGLIIATIADVEAAATTYTKSASTIETITTLGTYVAPTATKCRFTQIDATNLPGWYEIQLADARFAVANAKTLALSIHGAADLRQTNVEIQLGTFDVEDSVRAGLTAIPNAAAGTNAGLPVLDSALNVSANAKKINASATAAANLASMLTGAAGVTLTLDQIRIVATGNNAAIDVTGAGTGAGIKATGGATDAAGIRAVGGATNGDGVEISGTGAGHGIKTDGGATSGAGLRATGKGSGAGIVGQADGTGAGIGALGGVTSGDAIVAFARGGNGNGLGVTGIGDGHGLYASGGSGGNSNGVKGVGFGTGDGIGGVGGQDAAQPGDGIAGYAPGNASAPGGGAGISGVADRGAGIVASITNAADDATAAFQVYTQAGTKPAVLVQNDGSGAATFPADTAPDVTTLVTRLSAARAGYLDNLAGGAVALNADMATMLTRLTATRAGYLDNLAVSGLVAAQSDVLAIQNNTRTVVSAPTVAERPDAGETLIKIHLLNYDTAGNMEAPDSAPTVSVTNESGTSRDGNLQHPTTHVPGTSMVAISTGRYWIEYALDNADTLEVLTFLFSVVEGGVTRTMARTMLVVDTTAVDFTAADRAKLDTLHDSRLTSARAGYLDNLAGGAVALNVDISTLLTRLSAARAGYLDNLSGGAVSLNTDTQTLLGRLTAARAALLDNLGVGGLVASAAAIAALNDISTTEVRTEMDASLAAANLGALISGSVNDVAPTTTSFIVDAGLSAVTGQYDGQLLQFTSGALVGVGRYVLTYVVSGGVRTVTLRNALPVAPANGDTLVIEGFEETIATVTLGAVTTAVAPGNRVAGPITLEIFTNETKSFALAVVDANGDAVNIEALTLRFVVSDTSSPPVGKFKIEGGAITKSGSVATVLVAGANVPTVACYAWQLWDVTAGAVLSHGTFQILPARETVP